MNREVFEDINIDQISKEIFSTQKFTENELFEFQNNLSRDKVELNYILDLLDMKEYKTCIMISFIFLKEKFSNENKYTGEIIQAIFIICKALYNEYVNYDGFHRTVISNFGSNNPYIVNIVPSFNLLEILRKINPNLIDVKYLRAEILFEFYKLEKTPLEQVEQSYLEVINSDGVEELFDDTYHQLVFAANMKIGKLYSFASIQNETLLEDVFYYYNTAYRYGQKHDIDVSNVFSTVHRLTQLLNGELPVYSLIYNENGQRIFQYIFEEVKFAPVKESSGLNLSSLFAARDTALDELFNINSEYSILAGPKYVVIQSTLVKKAKSDPIYILLVFSNIGKLNNLRQLANFYEPLLEEISNRIIMDSNINNYLKNFKGKINEQINLELRKIIETIPSIIEEQ